MEQILKSKGYAAINLEVITDKDNQEKIAEELYLALKKIKRKNECSIEYKIVKK